MLRAFVGTFCGFAVLVSAILVPVYGQAASAYSCSPSLAPLFSSTNPNEVLPFTVMVDYVQLNRKGMEFEIPAVIAWIEGNQGHFLPVLLKQRGNIRRTACTDVPYKMHFLKPVIDQQVRAEAAKSGLRFGSVGYMRRYYEILTSRRLSVATDASAQPSGLFSGVGKSLKVVTHCGTTNGKDIYANEGGWVGQNRRVLAEHYVYQILGLFNGVVEDSRLAEIKYLNPRGQPVHSVQVGKYLIQTNYAILREPDKSLAERCGILKDPTPAMLQKPSLNVNAEAYFDFTFFNTFVSNVDFDLKSNRNIQFFYSPAGEVIYSAYDFDLSAMASVEYEYYSTDVFKKFNTETRKVPAYNLIKRQRYAQALQLRPRIESLVDGSRMSTEQKERFHAWFDEVFTLMKTP